MWKGTTWPKVMNKAMAAEWKSEKKRFKNEAISEIMFQITEGHPVIVSMLDGESAKIPGVLIDFGKMRIDTKYAVKI